jgi:hypothetical protein
MLNTPVLFLVFNRPDTTARVFAKIREAAPRQLFIAADGPRPDRPGDAEKCREVRELVARVDWDCEVKTLFRERNLGCRYAVSSAISWFFEHVPEGIILEDDTLPDGSFFNYCQDLLAHYRNDEKVMHIGGFNHLPAHGPSAFSYRFSLFCHVWGWATWRRAWQHYAVDLPPWEAYRKRVKLEEVSGHPAFARVWNRVYREIEGHHVDTWDLQWSFAVWQQQGFAVTPVPNLVRNIGIGHREGTHTTAQDESLAIAARGVAFPLVHNPAKHPDAAYDAKVLEEIYLPWDKKKSFKQVMHDRYYHRLPEAVKNVYRNSIKGFFNNPPTP